jgi:myosin-crossreactive antigen
MGKSTKPGAVKYFNDIKEQDYSKTVISTCISFPDRKSSVIGKTANECEIHEIYNEVYRQLKLSIKNLPVINCC